jgi:hypothetical protein
MYPRLWNAYPMASPLVFQWLRIQFSILPWMGRVFYHVVICSSDLYHFIPHLRK